MELGNYAMLLELKLKTLLQEYNLSYYKLFPSKENLVDFESIVVGLVTNLLPKDGFKVLKTIANLETKQYEVHLEINSKLCFFSSIIGEEYLGAAFWDQIHLLPHFSSYDIRLTSVSNDTFFLGEEIVFVAGDPISLVKAYNYGLPISHPNHSVWYKWIDNKKHEKSKMSYLILELEDSETNLDLKRLMIDGINSFAIKRKLLSVSSVQLELVDLSRSLVKDKLPIVQDGVNYDALKTVFINGDGIRSSLVIVENEIFLGGRLSDYIWAYAIVKEFKCNVKLIPYKENSAPSKILDANDFLDWVDKFMNKFPDLSDCQSWVV